MINNMSILKDNLQIGIYTVHSFIKDGQFNESYLVKDPAGISYFLKIYDPTRVPGKAINTDSIITEIGYCEKMNHPNVISYVEKGVLPQQGNNYPYLVVHYRQPRC